MPTKKKFFPDAWSLVADPPPCDPGNPARALAYCEEVRRGRRCSCQFDLAVIAADLDEVGLGDYADEFDDEVDADSLADLARELLRKVGNRTGVAADRLRSELVLLQRLAQNGSGVRPAGED